MNTARVSLACALTMFGLASSAQRPHFVPGQILIKPKAHLSDADLVERLSRHGARQRLHLNSSDFQIFNVPESRAEAVLAALQRDPDLEYAERDGIGRAARDADPAAGKLDERFR